MPLQVEVVTQEGKLFEENEADMVVVPASEGEMGILPHHAPVLTTLGFGELRIKKGRAEESFVVYGGIVEVRPGRVIVLADTAEPTAAVDIVKAEEARNRAQELMRSGPPQDKEYSIAQDLRRAEMALHVARKARNRNVAHIRVIEDTAND